MDIINDDMVKESKIWKRPMIMFFVIAALSPLSLIWEKMKTTDFISIEVFYILIGCFFLYEYLYSYKYKVVVNNEKIVLKTLFRCVEIQFKDIKTYNCKRYRKSKFYQFFIFFEKKKILIYTRYKDDFEKILKNKTNIE